MLEMLSHLLGLAFALSVGTGPLDAVAAVGVVGLAAVAVSLCARYLVGVMGRSLPVDIRQSGLDRAALVVLITQSDPSAAGRPRTRAPAIGIRVAS
ncbi:DUF6412 domain-containing protein [Agreia sp. COWG]|uniref:DUF6412 domain-containing protein n=1 Tax=Agreia sp. COWG TaxID=2773266 RepID=UPI001926CBBF|nr:DUF6412 domain-containing protein [Agreia sp. COWG]CAD5995878.1 conserved exported protein of unknown function [Agreia sp. COWG]